MPTKHYNLDYLKQVFQGNDAMVRRILDVFEEEVPRYFAEMTALGESGMWGALHPLAHKAKSSIGMLGMEPLLEQVLVIEQHSRTGGATKELQSALTLAQSLLDAALSELRSDRERSQMGLSNSPSRDRTAEASALRPGSRLHRA